MQRIALLIGLACAMGASGCATILAGGPDHVQITTDPPAQVFVDDQFAGTTPGIVTLDRRHSHGRIRIQAPGYQPVLVTRDKTINGLFWANLCLSGGTGLIVDLVTGDWQRFDDSPILINLTPMGGAMPPPGYGPPAGYGPPPGPPPMAPQPAGPGGAPPSGY